MFRLSYSVFVTATNENGVKEPYYHFLSYDQNTTNLLLV